VNTADLLAIGESPRVAEPVGDRPALAQASKRGRPSFNRPGDRPHLVHVYPTFDIGGVQVRFAALVGALGERFRHTVVSLSGEYGAAALIPANAPVRYAAAPSPSRSLAIRVGRHRSMLAELGPDLLLTYNWGAMEVVLANALVGLPHIHLEDGFGPEEAMRQFRRRIWTRRLALSRSQLIVPSRTLQTIATRTWRLDSRRVQHIPNGVAPLAECGTALGSLGLNLPVGVPLIVWAGALRREKNPLRLLRAFAPLKDRAVLLLIGDGPERDAIQEEAARLRLGGSLHLLGRRMDTRDIIMQCQVLALSSDTEQMPLAVLEAMEAGLPIAATDVGDMREMVAEPNRAFIVAPCDKALSGALDALVGDAALRARIGQANRTRQGEFYGLPMMAEAYGAAFERMSARARGRRIPSRL
jgi:glycosyltransferase involved in cell wall biosynthesis